MRIEFAFRTYSIFGGNATLNLAGTWLSSKLGESYGGKIESVLIELCCDNVSPAKKTLESNNERFKEFLTTLPYYEITEKGTELRICYRAVKIYHDEVNRDSQVLSLKLFSMILGKAIALIEPANEKVKGLGGFRAKDLASDINMVKSEAPKSLLEIAELYSKSKVKNAI